MSTPEKFDESMCVQGLAFALLRLFGNPSETLTIKVLISPYPAYPILKVWHLSSSTCVAILETPRDDLVPGVDFALNCLVINLTAHYQTSLNIQYY